jgi:hypothetical protein
VFSNYTGSVSSTNKTITFVMQTNFAVTANFVVDPFANTGDVYMGLFYETNVVHTDRAGSFNLTLSKSGTFSGTINIANTPTAYAGRFGVDGTAVITNLTAANLTMTLQADITQGTADVIRGTVSGSNWSAPIQANRHLNALVPQAGSYVVSMDGTGDGSTYPSGDSLMTLLVDAGGETTWYTMLSDGQTFKGQAYLSKDGLLPLYGSVNSGSELVIGWLNVTNLLTNSVFGQPVWVKNSGSAGLYPNGYYLNMPLEGSTYANPGTRLLNITNGLAFTAGGDLTASLTNAIVWTAGNQIQTGQTNKLQIAISSSSLNLGTCIGSITNQAGATLSIRGGMLQQQNVMKGFYTGPSSAGSFRIIDNV